jgi:hypothetical protein
MVECVGFTSLQLGLPTPIQAGSVQWSSPTLPGKSEIFFLFMVTSFVQKVSICPPTGLNYVVPWRADDVLGLPGVVAVSLGGIGSAPAWRRQESEVLCTSTLAVPGHPGCF